MMVKSVIVEDENHCVEALVSLLTAYHRKISLSGIANTIEGATELISKSIPDLVFLDVEIGSQTAFDFLRTFKKVPFDIIFTTAHEKYAVQAFKYSAFHYLLKPIGKEDFDEVIQSYFEKANEKFRQQKIETLLENINVEKELKKIAVPTGEGYSFLKIDNIVRLQAKGNYTNIHLSDGSKIMVSKTLKTFSELSVSRNFYRVHYAHLINLDFLKKYFKGKDAHVVLEDNSIIPISQRRKDDFIKLLKSI